MSEARIRIVRAKNTEIHPSLPPFTWLVLVHLNLQGVMGRSRETLRASGAKLTMGRWKGNSKDPLLPPFPSSLALLILKSRLRQTANVNLCHVTKFSLYLSLTNLFQAFRDLQMVERGGQWGASWIVHRKNGWGRGWIFLPRSTTERLEQASL